MTALESALADYLAVRRALGYKLATDGHQLAAFVAHLDALAVDTVTVAVALEWAAATPQGGGGSRRLAMVRGFARYLQAIDPAHEVPPTRLLSGRSARPIPFLYSDDDIATLMAAARALTPAGWGATVEVIIGLLWATGMRIGEVLRLDVDDLDVDTQALTVHLAKFGRSRLVPITPSTTRALSAYRAGLPATPTNPAMFVTPAGRRVRYQRFNLAFVALVDEAGITTTAGKRPRAHDARHSFAVRTLTGWYRDGLDVHALLPRLSTYLGHVEPASTYWYLTAAPELMALAADRLEAHTSGEGR